MTTISLPTLELCLQILKSQQINIGAPDFKDAARTTIVALDELETAIEERRAEPEPETA